MYSQKVTLHPQYANKFPISEYWSQNMVILQVQVASPTSLSVFKAFLVVLFFALSIYFILSVYSLYMILKIQKKSVTTFLDQEFEQGSKCHPSNSFFCRQCSSIVRCCDYLVQHKFKHKLIRHSVPSSHIRFVDNSLSYCSLYFYCQYHTVVSIIVAGSFYHTLEDEEPHMPPYR